MRIILVLMLTVGLIGCKTKSAFNYSERIVRMEVELSEKIAIADARVTRFLENDQQDSARITAASMEQTTAETWEAVKELDAPDVAEADNFKKEVVKYFGYLHSIYAAFNKFVQAPEGPAKEKERNKLGKIVKEKEAATRILQSAQQKFAQANNFRIGKK